MPRSSPTSRVLFVGVDDTDMPGIGGTGRLVRMMAAELAAAGAGNSLGVTRHQLFQGPGVPMTHRNSAAACAFVTHLAVSDLVAAFTTIVERDAIDGSDPGIAVLEGPCPPAALSFARRAQSTLVAQAEARFIAEQHDIHLSGHGGTEGGVIGALCAVALRVDGNDGRYVDLPGIREVCDELSVADLLDRTGITAVVDAASGEALPANVSIDVGGWVRPRLVRGHPVLAANQTGDGWVNADLRSRDTD